MKCNEWNDVKSKTVTWTCAN